MKIDKFYTLKVWLVSLMISPLIFIVLTLVKAREFLELHEISDSFLLMFFMFGYSLLYSLPSFLVYHLIFFLFKEKWNEKNKIYLSLFSIILLLTSVFLIFGNTAYNFKGNFSAITFSIIYSISIFVSTYLFKINRAD